MASAKFPRMPHLPWSPGCTSDDRRLKAVDHLLGKVLVNTEKMDGSNLCLTRETVYARSHSGPPRHPSFDLAKSIWSEVRGLLPSGTSVFAEWCYAKHSVH